MRSVTVFFLIIFYVCNVGAAVAEEDCEKGPGSFLSLRTLLEIKDYFFSACKKARTLEEKGIQNKKKFEELYRECELELQKKCVADEESFFKKFVSLSKVKQHFKEWKKNPLYHMQFPEDYSYQRAYLLAKEIAKITPYVKLLHIKKAAAMVRIVKDENEKPIAYYDQPSDHWAVQIEAKSAHGVMPYILDPQFKTEPVDLHNYFYTFVGQACQAESLSYWDCTYEILARNAVRNPSKQSTAYTCEWESANLKKEIELANVQAVNTTKIIPAELSKSDHLWEYLIREAYQVQKTRLAQEIQSREALSQKMEKGKKFRLETKKLKYDFGNFPRQFR